MSDSSGQFTIALVDKLVRKSNEVAATLLRQRIPNDIARIEAALGQATEKGWCNCSNIWTYEIKTHEEAAIVLKHFTDQSLPGRYVFKDICKLFIFEFDWSVDGAKNMEKKESWELFWVESGLLLLMLATLAILAEVFLR